jgi:pyrimidine operon attenuation protein/uracil phosphoribosyltransferase
MTETRNYILTAATALKKLQRMAYEIVEQNMEDAGELILAGIQENGVVLANIIAAFLKDIYKGPIKVIEITLNKRYPEEIYVNEALNYDDATIILIDDVTNSGKTLLYALKPFLAFHPKKIQTLTLVERSHKLFPVASDYVGISLASTLQEHIFVEVEEASVLGAYLV